MDNDLQAFLQVLLHATCYTRSIRNDDGSECYSGKFTCSEYGCPGCAHAFVPNVNRTGFPFLLDRQLGKGGFANVYQERGTFHQVHAAFKFIPVSEHGYTYNKNASIGCHEYDQQEMILASARYTNVDRPYGYLFVKMRNKFYFVLIMKLRKSNLRKMMNTGLVNQQIKQQVLKGLTPIVSDIGFDWANGDIKERDSNLLCISKKPDNILVDYGVGNAGVVNFEMAIGDWGTAGGDKKHYGGTPMYASKLAFRLANNKDLFTFGRLAMELYLSESVWLALTFFPIENKQQLLRLRGKTSSFMQNVQRSHTYTGTSKVERERICAEIINSASSDVDHDLIIELNQLMTRADNVSITHEHRALQQMNICSFQHHDHFKRTTKLAQAYQRENSMISDAMRSQGSSAYTCWAFSCASMLRTSCKLLIQRCHELGLISKIKMDRCTEYISEEEVHVEIRNLIMMILLPKKLHVDDSSQAAFLRAAVSRIANPTVMEARGLDFLYPIWKLMQPQDNFGRHNFNYIGLTVDQVRVHYTKYINDFKCSLLPGQISIRDAVSNQLTPVGSVPFNGSPHTMVLDTINEKSEFVFKNTHRNNKQYTLSVSDSDAPDEFFFIHCEPL